MSNKEQSSGEYSKVVEVYPSRGVVEIQCPSEATKENRKQFTYDAVYGALSTQKSLYDEVVRPLVSSVLEGFNGCVFAYGQTGTGKTFTMRGDNDSENQGVIPRAFEQIWAHINRAQNMNFLVEASYLEIYMEEVRDLLKPNSKKSLELREKEGVGVYVPNLHSVLCKSVEDMMQVMHTGNRNRTVGRTKMNESSSRSHAIFSVKIEMAEMDSNVVKVGKLNLIDLAGSERQTKTGATDHRLKEASKINRALSSLGNVISALAENSSHVPYRDSKLTRLLQDSLGGNSKTLMIANVGPSEYNYSETLTTLRYASRAKTIQNKPVKNEDPQDAKLREYQEEIMRLRKMIAERQQRERNGGTLSRRSAGDGQPAANVRSLNRNAQQADDEEEDEGVDEVDEENGKEAAVLSQIDKDSKEKLLHEREVTNELAQKLEQIEGQLVRGGRNIVDTYTERQVELERKLSEISERKKREVEMQQLLESQEESTTEIRETVTSLQQEVDLKTRKLKKCYAKWMALKQELVDTRDEHNRDRRELEMTHNELIKELKRLLLIIDNFVPAEVKSRLYTQARYDDEQEEWALNMNVWNEAVGQNVCRPISVPSRRRPLSEYAVNMAKTAGDKEALRYRGENILTYDLDMPLRTTYDYEGPKVSASLQAVLAEAMQTEADIDIAAADQNKRVKSKLEKVISRASAHEAPEMRDRRSRIRSSRPGMLAAAAVDSGGMRSVSAKRSTSAYPKATRVNK